MDLWFASIDPTLPAPWRSVMDESSGLVFYWNPETNVSQYEHPNPAPPPPLLPLITTSFHGIRPRLYLSTARLPSLVYA
ncbi:hypothetical protein ACFX15_003894 [Malus domestica]|uniref:WW domain-containing protein n=1 Tax=Malus domestica TaxID=3750 RepID=A0A498IWH8_MALDO|nr:hypothetical protein DVH24_021747 [Malus domestica]